MGLGSLGICAAAAVLATGAAVAQSDEFEKLALQGAAQQSAGQYSEAAATFEKAAKLAEKDGSADIRLAWIQNALGLAYDGLARYSDARPHYRRALALIEKSKGKMNADYASVLTSLASDYVDAGDPAAALSMLREAIGTYEKIGPSDSPSLALARSALGELLLSTGRFKDAEEPLQQSLAVFERAPGQQERLAVVLNNMGALRRYQSRMDEAVTYLERSIDVIETKVGKDHPSLIEPLNNLALAQMDRKDQVAARASLERAKSIAEARLGPEHPVYAKVLLNYGVFLQHTGHKSEGKKLQAQAMDLLRDHARTNGAGMTVDASAFRQ